VTRKPAEAATAAIEKLVAQQDWVALWDVRDQPERACGSLPLAPLLAAELQVTLARTHPDVAPLLPGNHYHTVLYARLPEVSGLMEAVHQHARITTVAASTSGRAACRSSNTSGRGRSTGQAQTRPIAEGRGGRARGRYAPGRTRRSPAACEAQARTAAEGPSC
jgi:hypothetical protein